MIDTILFTTSNIASGRSIFLNRLISSLEACVNLGMNIKLQLLLQKSTQLTTSKLNFPQWVNTTSIEHSVPLSVARNILLKKAFAEKMIKDKSIVAFPDDDCWYPSGSLKNLISLFETIDNLDFLFCRYASNACDVDVSLLPQRPSAQQVISYASSNTIFLRGQLVKKLKNFDETLGVGTALNGGEDTEYAIRAYLKARQSSFVDKAIVGHRDMDPTIRAKYFAGSFVAIRRNALKSPWVATAMARKLLVGLYFLILGRLDIRSFARAFQLN